MHRSLQPLRFAGVDATPTSQGGGLSPPPPPPPGCSPGQDPAATMALLVPCRSERAPPVPSVHRSYDGFTISVPPGSDPDGTEATAVIPCVDFGWLSFVVQENWRWSMGFAFEREKKSLPDQYRYHEFSGWLS